MTDLEQRLAESLARMADEAPTDPDLLGTVRARTGRRWPSPRVVVAVGAAAAVAVAGGVVAGVRHDDRAAQPAQPAAYDCPDALTEATLPDWARTGFSGSKPSAKYVLGDAGKILGVAFGDPLMSPASPDRANKVLWVVRSGAGPLTIRATLTPDQDPVVIQSVTGPSYLDLPSAGCWHLDLSWGDQTDSLNLRYYENPGPTTTAQDQGNCSTSGGDYRVARREAVEWAAAADHLVGVTVMGLEPGFDHTYNPEQMLVEVDRVWWSRPGALPLPANLDLTVSGCSVGVVEQGIEPNWVPGQRYVVPVAQFAPEDGLDNRWQPLSSGTVFPYDDDKLTMHEGLFLESTWAKQHLGEPASVLVDGLRAAERDNADLLTSLASEPDPYRRSELVRDGTN